MKFTKIFRAITIGVILSLLMIATPASPALAAYDEEISVDPREGEIGDYVDVEGFDFDYSTEEIIYVNIYFSADEADLGDDIDDEVNSYKKVDSVRPGSSGDFDDGRFAVPSRLTTGDDDVDVSSGIYYIFATYDDKNIVAVDEFKVIGGEIEIDLDEGPGGTEVEIIGTDFLEDEKLEVKFDNDDVDIESGTDDEADNDGEFESTIIIPESTAGDHTITVTGDEGSEAEATFTVEPEVTVNPTQAPPGDTVTISGTGFGDRVEVDIILCNVEFKDAATTDRDGNFTADITVPEVAEGIWDVDVEDEDGNDVETQFTVEIGTEVTISPVTSQASPGYVGMDITVSGVGFKANSQVTITYATTPTTVATTTSDANGAFTATFKIPQSEAGAHTITATDGTNTLQVFFTMESQAPPIPAPLSPEMDSKAEALAEFDWESVTDDSSPVTYTLQVATSDDFTTSSMVLEKEGLADSEYALTEAEALESRSEEEPYYWRVKATDGASNEGDWSGVGTFYVGGFGLGGVSFPDWMVHVWWGIGVVGAILFGFWLGRRRAYYY